MKKSLILSSALLMTSATVSADDFSDVGAGMKDTMLSVAGTEIVVPFAKALDTNFDTLPDSVRLRFDAYEAGSSTKVGSTTARTTALPLPACPLPTLNPASLDFDLSVRLVGDASSTRAGMLVQLKLHCSEIGSTTVQTSLKTIVYSGDLSSGASWIRTFDLESVGLDRFDFDKDTFSEYMLVMRTSSAGTEKYKVTWLNEDTGATEASNQYTTAIK